MDGHRPFLKTISRRKRLFVAAKIKKKSQRTGLRDSFARSCRLSDDRHRPRASNFYTATSFSIANLPR
ncbi:hypothetical protein HMPREF1988_01638 [Porphyromonas gingivalis F0185]|nr:hypothetical protein A343_2076 [Porphyromonas gingivalis JCVI SC001]ERJ82327.1 hypothetical protein HMPREF1988_01638 [Porphyromonas gingivalis F0185]